MIGAVILALLMQSTPTTTAAPPSADPPAPAPIGPLPSPSQLAWKEMGFTGFIHFGPNTFTDREWGHGDEPAAVFAPTQLDARQWVRAMKASASGVTCWALSLQPEMPLSFDTRIASGSGSV